MHELLLVGLAGQVLVREALVATEGGICRPAAPLGEARRLQ